MSASISPEALEANALRRPVPCPAPEPPSAIRDMTDEEIQRNMGDILENLGDIASARAEIHSEAGHYGDGPVGSAARLEASAEAEQRMKRELAILDAEWKRRHPPRPKVYNPPPDDQVQF